MASEIFISYRRADQPFARLLHSRLQAEGIEAWYDAQVGAGEDWRRVTAKALEDSWDGPLEGLVVTRYGYRVPTERLEVVEAAHPVPDATGRDAGPQTSRPSFVLNFLCGSRGAPAGTADGRPGRSR